MIEYPKLTWTLDHNGASMALTKDFILKCFVRKKGDDAGTWVATMNYVSLTSGKGKYGYNFDNEHQAKAALEYAMRNSIDARVLAARQALREE